MTRARIGVALFAAGQLGATFDLSGTQSFAILVRTSCLRECRSEVHAFARD